VVDSIKRGLNAFLAAEPGAGLTTSLRFIGGALRRDGWVVASVDGRATDTPLELLQLACFELATQVESPAIATSLQSALAVPALHRDAGMQAIALLRRMADALQECDQMVVVIDGPAVPQTQGLFGRLRDEMWTLPVRWVVGGDVRRQTMHLAPPADAFFDSQIQLSPLGQDELVHLVRLRSPDLPVEHAESVAGAARTPRDAIALLRQWSSGDVPPDERARQRAERLEQASALGRPAAMLLSELENGPASASDPALLSRMGWSRQRAHQVLRQLADAGLVEESLQSAGQGRPRRVYRVAGS
jgi:hypothetical protein